MERNNLFVFFLLFLSFSSASSSSAYWPFDPFDPPEDLTVAPTGGPTVYMVTVGWHKGLDTKHFAIKTLTSVLGSEVAAEKALVYVYEYVFPGFSAKLTPIEASELEEQPGILQVIPDRVSAHLIW